MTEAEQFKFGFLLYCAERGYDAAQTHALVKQALASPPLEKQAIPGAGLAWPAITAATLLPIGIGGMAGYASAKLTSPDRSDLVDDAKANELIDEYRRLAAEAQRRAQIRRLQQHMHRLAG